MENRLDELASLTDWVDDLALEPKWRLAPCHSTFSDGRREVTGARNLGTLRERLSHCMVRRVRKEVLKQLPPRTDTRVLVPLTAEQQGEHDELSLPIAVLARRARVRPLTQAEFLRLMVLLNTQRIICNGLAQLRFEDTWPSLTASRPTEALLGSLSSPKLIELRELLANIAVAQERKVVVFSQWRRMLKLASWSVSDILGSAGVRPVFFTGEEGQKRRTQNLVDFHDDPSARVLFSTDAGGVGLNLQRAASCCINLELPWNPAVLEQRVGRIYRMGQSRPVEVYHLVSETGIEARIAGLVGDKRALFSGLFDGASDEVAFERSGSFLSRIEQVLAPVRVPDLPELTEKEAEEDAPTEDGAELADDTSPDGPGPSASAPARADGDIAGALSAEGVRELFSRIQVRPASGGKVTFEAPSEAAAALAALFEGMARMLSGAPAATPTPAG
jgi:SNF2 family DNA or RNA helicase